MTDELAKKDREIAALREEVQTQLRQGVEKEREQYKQALDVQQKFVWNLAAQEFQNVDMGRLSREDPAEYIRVQNRRDEFIQAIQGIQAEQQKLAQQERDYLEKEVLPKASEQMEDIAAEVMREGVHALKQLAATAAQDALDLARLTEENEALRKDAERYRWLRNTSGHELPPLIYIPEHGRVYNEPVEEALDEAIDAAIKEGS